MFEALAASPIATLGLMSAGLALIALAFLIGRNDGDRRGFARGVGALVVTHVVREIRIDSKKASEAAAEEFRLREWLQ